MADELNTDDQLDLLLDSIGKDVVRRKEESDIERSKNKSLEIQTPVKGISKRRGRPTRNIMKQAELTLIARAKRGDFEQFPINPSNEFPTFLTRVPIFMPGKRTAIAKLVDEELAVKFETGWGRGRKFGPPLNVYDEDTLLALGALRQRRLVGKGDRMPVVTSNPMNPDDETKVDIVYTTISEIQRYLGLSTGGRALKKRLASIERLSNTIIELTQVSDKEIQNIIQQRKFRTKLIDLVQEDAIEDSYLFVQFPPVMVAWLENSYTYINMDIRKNLRSDIGKLIHKFLASQRNFQISFEKLQAIVGSKASAKEFGRRVRETMKQLEEMEWVEYTIEGTGRSTPHVLKGRVLRKT